MIDAIDSDYKIVGHRVVGHLLEAADAQRIDRRAVELATQYALDMFKKGLGYGIGKLNRHTKEVKMVRGSI